jgi:ribulose-5-phosphate 4-epimerase/fuculose-1-phosphate aldolase|tara:strand:- start:56 stop:799 length:744 start_codon:yes stop_codon:yes gene_type:complete
MNNPINVSQEEWNNRIDLAASFHLADYFGWSDIIWNHITSKTSKDKNTFLINKFGLRYDEITASNLLEVDLDGNVLRGEGNINYTGFVIHGAIHKEKKDIHSIMHTHSRAGLAISCLKMGLDPIIQDAAMFYNRVSYHDWEGMSTNSEECKSISEDLGKNNVMILRNHGLLTAGKTIGETFMLMYYLDRACKVQLDLASINKEIIKPSDNLLEFAAGQYEDPKYQLGKHEWPALLRLLDDNKSIYNQ